MGSLGLMKCTRSYLWLLVLVLMFAKAGWAEEPVAKNLAEGLAPLEAAKAMSVPEGFRVKLAAGEPSVHQPIAFAIDRKGRLWVAEAYTYPLRAADGEGRDKIIILEDTTGDGRLDSRKVFCEGLNLISGLEVGFGGVWVGAAPYVLFIPDADGDDLPDAPAKDWKVPAGVQFPHDVPLGATVLLDGFGWQDTHETLNSFIWGPDGWLYGCHGVFTHSNVGKPGTPASERVPLNAGVWRYHPVKHVFEVFAWGTSNPWGVDFNEEGQAFVTACVIPHLFHIIPGARYERQAGQHFNPQIYDDIKTIADHRHYVGNIRDHAWWGHEPQAAGDTLKAGGGHAHAGAMIYLGDNWPKEYRNKIYMNNIHGNRVNCDVLERKGSGYVGHHGKDLLIANDRWFRGINLKTGPDGSVYLIDWYDKNACHRRTPEIWDRTNGRIYNIAYVKNGEPQAKKVDLGKLSNLELAKLHRSPNEWQVRMARKILQERAAKNWGDAEMLDVVMDLSLEALDFHGPLLRVLWTLSAIGGLTSKDLLQVSKKEEESVRGWAVRLEAEDRKLGNNADEHAEWLKSFRELANDSSAAVRLEVAAAIQRLPLADRWEVAEVLLSNAKDAEDHNLPLMIWYAVEPLVSEDAGRAMRLAKTSKIPLVTRFIIRRAASDNKLLPEAVALLNETEDAKTQLLVLNEILAAFEGRVNVPMPESWKPAYDKLSKSKNETLRQKADQVAVALGDQRIFPRMREVLADKTANQKSRKQALDILVRGRDKAAVPSFQAVLDQAKLRGPAIRALAGFDDPKTPDAILQHYQNYDSAAKGDAIGTLTSRPSYALALLAAMEAGKVPRTDLHAYHIRQLMRFENHQLHEKIRKTWGEFRETSADKKAQIAGLKTKLSPQVMKKAEVSHGRALFAKTCANCHTLFGEGGKVGPDITGSNRANVDYLLGNIVDPSAVLGKDYRMSVLALGDGRVVSGLIQKETDSALTIRTLNDTVVIPLNEIEARKLSELSMMPEKLLDQLSLEDVRDLVAYLQSPAQVELKGPPAPIDPKTGKVAGAGEGESLKILSKTGGSARGQNMQAFSKDRWSGTEHLWWTGAKPGQRLELEIPGKTAGTYTVEIVLTRARDYGVVQLSVDDQKLGGPVDLYNGPDVITTGVLAFENIKLKAGQHRLKIKILGANPKAAKGYMVGLDYVRLVPATE